MIFVIDSGNSYAKIGQFIDGKLTKIYQKQSFKTTLQCILENNPDMLIIGTVNFPADQLITAIGNIPVFKVHTALPVPIKMNYKTPETLGIDRLAVAVCAWKRSPDSNTLVIDAGSCITYDFISKDGHYMGGGISPGVDMRLKSLNEYTRNLPLIKPKEQVELIGDTTENSILSGVILGTVTEIEGIISRYIQEYGDLTIFMSGGSAFFFESKIKHSIFAFPNMVLLGLYMIYEYNHR